jgi:DNA helicase TIP49 (TBP-interacting protein)
MEIKLIHSLTPLQFIIVVSKLPQTRSDCKSCFGGEVTSVIIVSPVNKAVTILHGDYFTVYQNLSSVSVSKGDKVSIKQSIGKVRTNGDSENGFEIYDFSNSTLINPEGWLSPR